MNYILFVLLVLGVSYAISKEMISLPLREWVRKRSQFFGDLISCPTCTSFWVALILGIFITPVFPLWDGFILLFIMRTIEKIMLSINNEINI